MKHYANYRAQIRRMSDESTFTSTSAENSLDSLDSAQPVGLKPFYPAPPVPNDEAEGGKKWNGPNPYKDYLKRRRKVVIYQIIVFVILAVVFTVWMLLLLQRS